MQGALCMSAPCRGGGHHRAPGRIQSSGSCSGRLELHSPSASSRAAAPRVGACCSGASRNLTGQGRLNPNRLSGSGRRATYPRFSHASGGDVSPVPPTAPRPPRLDEEDSPTPPSVQVVGTYTEETDKTVSVQRTDRFTTGATSTGILKINQDLQLFRCRTLRHKAFYVLDKAERAAMMHQVEEGFRLAIDMDPTDGRAYVSLGKHLGQQRRYDDANRVYEDGCAATQGQNPFIWQAWATLEAKRGNVNKARKYYDAATVSSEKHVTAWHGWGQLEKNQGNFARARELWIKGLQKATEPNEYLFQSLGVLAHELGNIDEARRWFRSGTEQLQGKSAHAIWQAWALMECEHGDNATVRFLFRKGLEANPKSRYIYLAWGKWEMNLGITNKARKILLKGNQVNPLDPAIYQALGVLEESQGNLELARSYFESGLEVDPSHIYLWQAWGVLEWRQGNIEEARRLFQQGIWADPKSKDVCTVFQAWGCLERENGNISLARSLLKCAVKADPTNEVPWMSWVQLEESLGCYQRADDIRNFSMQERVELVTPQLTSADLRTGWEKDRGIEGVGPSSFGKAVQQISKWLRMVSKPAIRGGSQ